MTIETRFIRTLN